LKMRGTWSKEEAKRVRKRLEEVRRNWEIG
jgi:hypothetical protein